MFSDWIFSFILFINLCLLLDISSVTVGFNWDMTHLTSSQSDWQHGRPKSRLRSSTDRKQWENARRKEHCSHMTKDMRAGIKDQSAKWEEMNSSAYGYIQVVGIDPKILQIKGIYLCAQTEWDLFTGAMKNWAIFQDQRASLVEITWRIILIWSAISKKHFPLGEG